MEYRDSVVKSGISVMRGRGLSLVQLFAYIQSREIVARCEVVWGDCTIPAFTVRTDQSNAGRRSQCIRQSLASFRSRGYLEIQFVHPHGRTESTAMRRLGFAFKKASQYHHFIADLPRFSGGSSIRLSHNNTRTPFSIATAHWKSAPTTFKFIASASFFAASLGAFSLYIPIVHAESPPKSESQHPTFRLSEVRNHGPDAPEKWVTKGTKVYNITDWIPHHPGGDVILRAVGGAVDGYWNILTIHKKQDVYDILEYYYIGDVDPRDLVDGKVPTEIIDDPFKTDPTRDARLVVHSERPYNAETPADALGTFVTPTETFYVRHHMWVPEVEPAQHQIVIEFPDGEEKKYSLEDLKRRFDPVRITATLQCSGNRRKHMSEESRSTHGLQWTVGGISNGVWTGVRLRDVLRDAGFPVDDVPDDIKHAQFMGAESYGASIPIEKAVEKRGDVIIAYALNDQPLPVDHGYPLRVVVPGNVAARSVKWLQRITLSENESPSQWQQRDYKCFGPNVGGGNPDWSSMPAIQELPVQSAITSLRDISSHSEEDRRLLQVYGIEENSIIVEGYSFSGGGRRIIRVDVSADDGRTWHQAELLPDESIGAKSWAWKRWRWILPRHKAGNYFVVKAVDEAYNTQPAEYEANWNFRGLLTQAWHRVGYKPDS